jgi:putative phosphoribosyl transferase
MQPPLLVLALPRGGVPVAYEVARALGGELDVLVVRKLGMPGQPEFALGALAAGNVLVYDPSNPNGCPSLSETVHRLAARERGELARREQLYRAGRAPLDLKHKTVILVDDGLATGSTMLAAVRAARAGGAAAIIVAAPVASREAVSVIKREADEIVVLRQPDPFFSVGQWYEQFDQIEDTEVCRLLAPQHRDADYSPSLG